MIIDWHTHIYPPSETSKPVWKGRCQMTIQTVLDAQERAGIDMTVVSNPLHYLRKASRDEALASIRESNLYLAELQDTYAGRIVALAASIPGGGDGYLKELERAITRDGLKGVFINSSHQGAYPDDPEARDFFRLASDLDIPVVIHPPSVGFGEERMAEFRLASSVGRPFDSCLTLARMILYGVFEQFPTLKVVATHLGGGISEIVGRLDYNYALHDEGFYTRAADSAPMLIKHPPSHYLRNIYLDSVSYHLPALKCGLETVGVDHMVFGTDAPPLTPLKQRGLDLVRSLGLPPADMEKILSGNATRLLKLN
ncbi:MAG: amidohydrolase family protein [Gemmatimonas sp.]